MDKDIFVSIAGLQLDMDTAEALEIIYPAKYYFKNGKHYVLYEEMAEDEAGASGISKNRLKIGKDCIELSKKGFSNITMVFEPEKQTTSYYKTPYGDLIVGIFTRRILVNEQEKGIVVSVDYSLDINYAHVSDCNIIIKMINR